MKFIRLIGNFFAYFGVGMAISMIFLALFVNNLFTNTDKMEATIVEDAKAYLMDHKEELKQYLSANINQLETMPGVPQLSKNQLKQVCVLQQGMVSEQLCSQLDSMTDEQAKQAFVKELVDTQLENQLQGDAFNQQAQVFVGPIKDQLAKVKAQVTDTVGEPINYLFFGIIIFLVSTLLIFFSEGLNLLQTSYKISRDLALNSFPFMLLFGLFALINPTNVSDMLSRVTDPTALAKIPVFLVTMLTTMALNLVQASTNPVLVVAIIIFIMSLSAMLFTRHLIKKGAPEAKNL